jgi:hypothetical protein
MLPANLRNTSSTSMKPYTCSCGATYEHVAEIIQSGGSLRYTDTTSNIFPRGNLIFTCRCGEEMREEEIWISNQQK